MVFFGAFEYEKKYGKRAEKFKQKIFISNTLIPVRDYYNLKKMRVGVRNILSPIDLVDFFCFSYVKHLLLIQS